MSNKKIVILSIMVAPVAIAVCIFIIFVFFNLTIFLGNFGIPLLLYGNPQSAPPPALSTESSDSTIGYKMIPMHDGTIMFPIITRFRDEKIKDKVNAQLKDFADNAGCYTMKDSQDDLRSFATLFPRVDQFASQNVDSLSVSQLKQIILKNTTYKLDTSVTYAQNDILSLKITMSNSCGGAYPNDGIDQSITFDMKTGEGVSFGKLFREYNQGDPDNPVNSVLATYFEQKSPQTKGVADCVGMYDTAMEANYSITQTHELRISYQFAHAIAACNQEITVPIKSLSKFFGPESILSRVQ